MARDNSPAWVKLTLLGFLVLQKKIGEIKAEEYRYQVYCQFTVSELAETFGYRFGEKLQYSFFENDTIYWTDPNRQP